MAFQVPQGIPQALAAGDTWEWDDVLADYPVSEGWTLTYYLRGATNLTPDPTATPDLAAGVYHVVIPATSTTALPAGSYAYAAVVTKAGETHTVRSGVLTVTPDVAQAGAGALATYAETMLAAIEAVLAGRATADVESYQIDGQALTRIPFAELRQARTRYAWAVWRERHQQQLGPQQQVAFVRQPVASPLGLVYYPPGTGG